VKAALGVPASRSVTDRESTCSNGELVMKGATDIPQVFPKDTPFKELDNAGCRVLEMSPFGLFNAVFGGIFLLIARSQESLSASSG
jgi:hypothetical protein